MGLRFQDIDFENKTISIRHSLVESVDSKCPVLKDCKTDGSNRTMVVSDYTMKLLKQQKLRYNTNRMRYGKDFGNSNMVISKEDGNYFLPKTRHSAISFLLSQGVPLHIVQKRAGHQDPKITLSVYSHVAKDDERVVADKLESTIFPAVNE